MEVSCVLARHARQAMTRRHKPGANPFVTTKRERACPARRGTH